MAEYTVGLSYSLSLAVIRTTFRRANQITESVANPAHFLAKRNSDGYPEYGCRSRRVVY